jgi:hypothetical protein
MSVEKRTVVLIFAKQDAIGRRARTQAFLRFSNNDSIDV